MKATGIIRRVDDLGRVVIPKEIRRTLHIREGEALEIYTDNFNGMPVVSFAKYEHGFAEELACIGDKIHEQMTDCSEYDLAIEFRKIMEKASKLLKQFEERE